MAFKVNHLHLKTPDPRKTAKWYVDHLGAKIVSERETPGGQGPASSARAYFFPSASGFTTLIGLPPA